EGWGGGGNYVKRCVRNTPSPARDGRSPHSRERHYLSGMKEIRMSSELAGPEPRRNTVGVNVGGVQVGGGTPIVVQSMTNTDTADVDGTVRQIAALNRAGSEMVRITVDRDEAAAA